MPIKAAVVVCGCAAVVALVVVVVVVIGVTVEVTTVDVVNRVAACVVVDCSGIGVDGAGAKVPTKAEEDIVELDIVREMVVEVVIAGVLDPDVVVRSWVDCNPVNVDEIVVD